MRAVAITYLCEAEGVPDCQELLKAFEVAAKAQGVRVVECKEYWVRPTKEELDRLREVVNAIRDGTIT